jgi:uncharacterized protein YggE
MNSQLKLHLFLATLIVAFPWTTFAAPREFNVTGVARVFYEPDAYDVAFSVVTEDVDIQKCKSTHLAKLENVSAYLRGKKESIISLKHDATTLAQRYDSMNSITRVFRRFETGYVARIKGVEKQLLELQEGLVTAGVTDILGVDLFAQNMPELMERARKDAIKEAKKKAALAAEELGWTLAGPVHMSFQDVEWWKDHKVSSGFASRVYTYDMTKRTALTTFITSTVNVTFQYEVNQ